MKRFTKTTTYRRGKGAAAFLKIALGSILLVRVLMLGFSPALLPDGVLACAFCGISDLVNIMADSSFNPKAPGATYCRPLGAYLCHSAP